VNCAEINNNFGLSPVLYAFDLTCDWQATKNQTVKKIKAREKGRKKIRYTRLNIKITNILINFEQN